jgi:glycosyltransferase involved in cell wall biosynthesis
MISIIICSRNQPISNDLSENIKNTVGCEYELIVIDNSENKYSIFEAYNLGIDKSTADYLCFIHDDILFHTQDWGKVVQRIFSENKQIGLIGVAGAKSKTKMPSLWWSCPKEDKIAAIIQHIPERGVERWNSGFEKESLVEVVVVDGVFMALRKDDRIRFSTEMTGFHNYDLNLSFVCKKLNYKIMVTNEILIEHFSLGTINDEWIESSYRFYSLYKKNGSQVFDKNKANKKQEITNAIWFITECLKIKKYKIALSIWVELFYLNPFLSFHVIYWKNNFMNNTDLLIEYFSKK